MPNAGSAVDRFPRLSGEARVRCHALPAGDDALDRAGVRREFVQNICGGGVRFDTDRRFARGTMLAVRIELPGLADAILALGRVVRCAASDEDPGRDELVVEFYWTGWEQRQVNDALHRLVGASIE